MKTKISLILFSALLSTTFAWSAENSAYYELPEGAFAQGLSSTSASQTAKFFLPHTPGQKYTFVSKSAGLWTSGSGTTTKPSKEYSYTSQMKKEFHTPQLAVGDDKYQYGSDGGVYLDNLYFYVGDSLRYYMTPAMMYNDQGKQAHTYIANYKSENRDTVGVFFNNTDVMYIDGISIPITSNVSGETKDNLFPNPDGKTSHVVVNIYKATTTSTGKKTNQVDRLNSLWTYTFTKDDFKEYSTSSYRGALNKSFTDNPITIDGPFVVELTEMKKTGCKFYIYAAKERPGCNKWGYYVGDDGTETYPDYTPAISVRAMFPALYTNGSLDIRIPTEGGNQKRTIFANYKWTKDQNGWKRTETTGITMSYESKTLSADSTVWFFKMGKNETNAARKGDVIFTFRGKELKFHVIQPPTVNDITISKTVLSLKANETAELTATVFPSETTQEVTWVSEDETIAKVDADGKVTAVGAGTTKIKAISADPDKYATCEVTVTPKVETYNVPTSNLIAPSTAEGDVQFTNNNTNYKQIQYKITGKNFVEGDWTVTFSEGCDWVEYGFVPNSQNRAIITLKTTKSNQTESNRSGSVTIKAYGYEFNYSVTQAPMIKQIVGLPNAIPLKVGGETVLTATVLPETTDQAKTVTWSSSADGVATVGTDGKVTAKGVGTAIITAQSDANSTITKTCTVTVYEVTPEKDPTTTTLTAQPAGGETTVAFTLSGATFNEANWSVTENPDWITETAFTSTKGDNSTTVTCTLTAAANATGSKREGEVTITAFSDNKFTYSITQEAAPEPDFTLEDKAAGAYATICLPGKIDNVENATLFRISHGNINKVEFEEVTNFTYEPAGMPYLVQVTETGSVKFFCDKNETTTEPVSRQDANGFVGSLQEEPQDVPNNNMSLLVSGGQLHLAAENCHLTKNHAYIDVNNVPASPIKAPNMAARRVTLYNPNAVPTNLNGLNGIVKPMKVLRDGQLYIIRDTKTYNAQGIEVQ